MLGQDDAVRRSRQTLRCRVARLQSLRPRQRHGGDRARSRKRECHSAVAWPGRGNIYDRGQSERARELRIFFKGNPLMVMGMLLSALQHIVETTGVRFI